MNNRNISLKFSAFVVFLFLLSGCQKENNWETTIELIYDITAGEARVEADFYLPRNDNYVYVGVCLSNTENPTVDSYLYDDKQELNSDINAFYFDGLSPNTIYYARSFIKTKSGAVIYSDNQSFTTSLPPDAPCESLPGRIEFDGSSYTMSDLDETPSDNYKLSTSCALGELDFTFNNKPTANVYTTVSPSSDLTSTTVQISGILGGIFSCYYGVSSGFSVYVTILDSDEISIEFCDVNISSASCDNNYELFGEVHQ